MNSSPKKAYGELQAPGKPTSSTLSSEQVVLSSKISAGKVTQATTQSLKAQEEHEKNNTRIDGS